MPEPLSERQFWINYFSQKHGIKISVAEEAERLAKANPGGRGFIHKGGAASHLRLQFVEAMRDAGVHLKLHQGSEVFLCFLSLPDGQSCALHVGVGRGAVAQDADGARVVNGSVDFPAPRALHGRAHHLTYSLVKKPLLTCFKVFLDCLLGVTSIFFLKQKNRGLLSARCRCPSSTSPR